MFVAIVPDADRAAANAIMEAAGYGPNNFNAGLSPTSGEPPTHWASVHHEDVYSACALPVSVTVLAGSMASAMATLGLLPIVTP